MLKKLLAGLSAVVLSLGLIALVAGPASAHTHDINASCSSVKVTLSNYESNKHNTVDVWINGIEQTTVGQSFGSSFSATYNFDQSQATNTYRVKVVENDNPSSSYSFDTGTVSVDRCPISVTPGTPQFKDAPCTGPGVPGTTGQYFIPTTAGVDYSVKLGGSSSSGTYLPATAGWNDVPAGTHVWIKATLEPGYVLDNHATTSWNHTIDAPSTRECLVAATPHHPTYSEPVCAATNQVTDGTVTIPSGDTGVQYWIRVGSGAYTAVDQGSVLSYAQGTTVTVKATALTGYDLDGSDPTYYSSHTFSGADAKKCVTPTPPVVVQFTCTGPGTHTDASYTIVATNHVTYKIGATTVSGGPNLVTPLPSSFTITAYADNHYTLVGTSSWPLTFSAATDCLVNATAGDPLFVNSACNVGTPGSTQGTYELIAAANVTYTVNVNGTITTGLLSGVFPANPGDVVEITAVPNAGYTLTNTPFVWDHTFTDPGKCTITVTTVMPGVTDQTCTVDGNVGTLHDGYIDIPATTGVDYSINGSVVSSGPNYLTPGTYTVTAAAQPGYILSGYPADGWSLTIAAADLCGDLITHPAVTPLVTVVQLGCSTSGSYTLSNDLADASAVFWTVNGSPVSQGTYQVTSAQTVTIHVDANGPAYGFNDPAQQQDWTLTFAAATSCDLKTLALTGSDPSGGMLLAYFLLLTGLGVVTVRAVRRHGRPQE
jgi:hypothetical protein